MFKSLNLKIKLTELLYGRRRGHTAKPKGIMSTAKPKLTEIQSAESWMKEFNVGIIRKAKIEEKDISSVNLVD